MEKTEWTFEQLPFDAHLSILSHVTVGDLLHGVCKLLNEAVRKAISLKKKNSIDCVLTGIYRAGTTTLFMDLTRDDADIDTKFRPHNEGCYLIKQAKVSSDQQATFIHSTSYHKRRKNIYPYYGLSQCIIFVLPATPDALTDQAFQKEVRDLLASAYAMSGHTNWIFVITKMDNVLFSQQVFNDVSQVTISECQKLSGKLADHVTIIPTILTPNLTANVKNTVRGTELMPWYTGLSVRAKIAEISRGIRVPLYKYFRPANYYVFSTKTVTYAKPKNKDDLHAILIGYLSDGFLSVNDKFILNPNYQHKLGSRVVEELPKFTCEVNSIEEFDERRASVAAGNYVGMLIRAEVTHETIVTYKNTKTLLHLWLNDFWRKRFSRHPLRLKKKYHQITTDINARSYKNIEIQVVMCESAIGDWNGTLKVNDSIAFYTLGVRTYCTLKKILSVQNADGEEIADLSLIRKGYKAVLEVQLAAPLSLRVFDKRLNQYDYPNSEGRCIFIMKHVAVALGIVTKLIS